MGVTALSANSTQPVTNAFPVSPHQRRRLPWFQQFRLLLGLLIKDIRSAAPFLILIGFALPMGFFWIISNYVGTGPETTWLLAGTIIMTVSFGSVSFAIQRTALMKVEGELDYYSSLSIHKGAFITAVFTESIIFSLPPLFTSMIIGSWRLDIPWSNLTLVIPIAILAASSMIIVGSTIGSYAKHMGHFAVLSYLPYLFVIFLSPALLPIEKLPFVLKITSYVFPTGQAALALNDVLQREFGLHFWLLIGGLLLWLIVAVAIALKKLDWRSE